MSVLCPSVSVYDCPVAHLITTILNFTTFSLHVTLAVAWSSVDDNAIRYVFPVLWMPLCFHMMGLMGRIGRRCYVWSSSPSGGNSRRSRRLHAGAKFAIPNCLLLLILIIIIITVRNVLNFQ